MVYEYCVVQSLSKKCGLPSPSGLVPSGRVPQAQAAERKTTSRATFQNGVMQVWLLGVRNRSQHAYLTVHLWLRTFGWYLESMGKPQVKLLLVYALVISHLPKAARGYTFCSWTPGHVLSSASWEHIRGFCLRYVATPWDLSCKMDPRSCPLWIKGTIN